MGRASARVDLAACVAVLAAVFSAAAAHSFELTDEQYHEMPRLFELDDWEECLAQRRPAFCMASFDLLPHQNDALLGTIKNFSANKYHFNHTLIHRGYCLPLSCADDGQAGSLQQRFARCVHNLTVTKYGLAANLSKFEYCRTSGDAPEQIDQWDLTFAFVTLVILVLNVIGTAYDLARKKDGKPIQVLQAWSVVANWKRLTADYSDGDPRLTALKPVQGLKALMLMVVMMAHTVLAYHYTYILNPQFLEKTNHNFLTAYLQNGTSVVQLFVVISCFLLAYNLLLYLEAHPERKVSLLMLPKIIIMRVVRLLPVYVYVVSLATTWWRLAGDGPQWAPLVAGEAARCRRKWWAYPLFLNNFIRPDERCLIHTWFIAVDTQLYVVSAALTLVLARRPRGAARPLLALIAAAMLANFGIAYYWHLKPMVSLMFPEFMRTQFEGQPSFEWMYSAPWDSLPSALIGLLLAFLHHSHQRDGFQPADSLTIRVAYRAAIPGAFLWVVSGYWMKAVGARAPLALYAALDRPAFSALAALVMYGAFHKIDSWVWRLLSWRGWEVAGRMSLSVFMIHWLYTLMILAQRTSTSAASYYDAGGPWFCTMFLSYWTALPLHLMLELPAQKFLKAIFL